ncbi:uncharacterized protein LOC110064251 isoform X2 [Orbicella faveolata]|uniref:uncharacterized protein LOC110064251 isoform X1 n=1 Tax=Orbicella faveolata TaxID=48498 RepID=UPI0009E605F1|nr:uncharacterized protein LOC110064251 isoform X1 [Orbicella faveolata]XP_020626930.1 uncharacterized protein LOC110064251 isoform X2 [Orbicella faveolata]
MASSMITWFVFVIFTSQTTASHFRGGIITWKPDEYIGNKVNFNFRLGFRRSFSNSYFCDSAMVAQQSIVGSGGTWSASYDRGYYGSRTVADTGYHCTDFSVSEDWTQGENTFNYTFPDDGPWLVSYSSCCWISLANGGGNWFLSTTVNLTRRQDNGIINSSPISALSPIVRHQRGCSKTIAIPAEDSDGDKVRCRWSNGSQRECGGVCRGFSSSGTLDEERCTLRLHSNAALGWHAVAITLEDFPASTTNFQTATPFSHVSLQFLVHVASSSGPCNRAPLLIGQSPNDGSCEEVPDGGIFYSIIEAKHIDSSRRIAEIITVTPLYMNLTSLLNYTDNVGDTVYYKNVSWSPRSSQKGRHIFCFKAIDDYGMESNQRCITILVGSNNTPRPILSTRTPLIPTLSWPWGSGFVDFNITFDQQIKRPRHSKFIRIILEGHVIYRLGTRSSSDVTIDQNGFTLHFRLPQVVMSMRGNYSVTMDRGAVVGLGCTSDGPPTPGISSTKSWTFSVGVCSKGSFLANSYACQDVDECSNPPSILSRRKRNIWYWPYSSATATLLPAIYSSPLSTEITPTASFAQGSSASITSTVSVSDGFTPLPPLSLAIQSTATIYSPPNLLTSSPTENLSRKSSITTPPIQAFSSAKYSSPYLLKPYPTSSVAIQASTAMVIPTASRVPFVLHLPANCQHNCVNTWGSYYCTCRQGYKLQADGTTCVDINECETQNGGCTHQCINIPGSHYCKCREGTTMSIDNKTCHEPGINVKCMDEAMSIFLERKSFKGFDPNKLTLRYPSCRASYNDTHITLRTSLNDCGTTHNESEDAITFHNEVRSVQFSPGNIITREQNVSIPFYCSFGRKAMVRNPSFKTWKNFVSSSEGNLNNKMFSLSS